MRLAGAVDLQASSFVYSKKLNGNDEFADAQKITTNEEDNHQAQILMREESVYRYFFRKNAWSWVVARSSLGVQIWMAHMFVLGMEFDFQQSSSKLVYTWQYPRDKIDCRDTIGTDEICSLMWVCVCEYPANLLLCY